jgi:hypothetical protein
MCSVRAWVRSGGARVVRCACARGEGRQGLRTLATAARHASARGRAQHAADADERHHQVVAYELVHVLAQLEQRVLAAARNAELLRGRRAADKLAPAVRAHTRQSAPSAASARCARAPCARCAAGSSGRAACAAWRAHHGRAFFSRSSTVSDAKERPLRGAMGARVRRQRHGAPQLRADVWATQQMRSAQAWRHANAPVARRAPRGGSRACSCHRLAVGGPRLEVLVRHGQ